jgi:non-heme Fe2+,alpha-ketoglutarate-dependent halogenase
MPDRLTKEQVSRFRAEGILFPLPVYSPHDMVRLNTELTNILDLLQPGETTKEIREWHETSNYLLDICLNPVILDYVEAILGPNFYLWASNFFIKERHTGNTVAWHQDSYYWPLKPVESLTVWLAFDDVDQENGAMRVIPGSHHAGRIAHHREAGTDSVLSLAATLGDFKEAEATAVNLASGEASIHDDKLLHSSPANPSPRRRAGFTIRYSPSHVVCDLSVNPHFRVYPARGITPASLPRGPIPTHRYDRLHRAHMSIEEAGEKASSGRKR